MTTWPMDEVVRLFATTLGKQRTFQVHARAVRLQRDSGANPFELKIVDSGRHQRRSIGPALVCATSTVVDLPDRPGLSVGGDSNWIGNACGKIYFAISKSVTRAAAARVVVRNYRCRNGGPRDQEAIDAVRRPRPAAGRGQSPA